MMKNVRTYTVEQAKKLLENYCAYQERCHMNVEKKLNAMHIIPAAQEIIILHLLKENYLNEERFAKAFSRGKFLIKKYGKVRIANELKHRQISSYLIKKGLEEIEETPYINTLKDLISKKLETIKETNSFKKKKKVIDYLLRKGYEYELIKQYLPK